MGWGLYTSASCAIALALYMFVWHLCALPNDGVPLRICRHGGVVREAEEKALVNSRLFYTPAPLHFFHLAVHPSPLHILPTSKTT